MGTDGDGATRNVRGTTGRVERGLTVLQARFVDEHLFDGNAMQAAIRAGYSAKSAATLSGSSAAMSGYVGRWSLRRTTSICSSAG